MKVLKFGGTSVGSVFSIQNVKKIVEGEKGPVIVVVSAVGGITDRLLLTSDLAVKGNSEYLYQYKQMVALHRELIEGTVVKDKVEFVLSEVNKMFEELANIFTGIYLIKDLSGKTSDLIVSYGERISSFILSHVIVGAKHFDSCKFIKTDSSFSRHIVNAPLTNKLIRETFKELPSVSIVPGFISTSAETGNITNLGRGGSDYTASLIAAELHADVLEIWTDVDGFMTADPKVINNAYLIESLSYVEAMELCNFGAKVVYPPTIYPVCHKNIPILIKNTFRPEQPGTYISNKSGTARPDKPIKGISSISDTSLITVRGLGMVGVIGVNYRIFKALAKNGISVFLVAQASSENSTTLGVRKADALPAAELLNQEFAKEISMGEIETITAKHNYSTIAVVGEDMRNTPGVAGKLFDTLGRNGINMVACAQGAPEMHISFVVNSENLGKALRTIHDSFFLSDYQIMNLFLAGVGTVGGNLLLQIEKQQPTLLKTNSLRINVVGVSNSRHYIFDKEGINIANYKQLLKDSENASKPEALADVIIKHNLYNCIFVDCTASDHLPVIYKRLLQHNVSVVTANKIAASSSYSLYEELKRIARAKGVKFLFETNVGAGLPIINTMNALINSGDRIVKLEAVLSGTLNYIFNTLSADIPLSKAVKMAQEAGYSEPDPRIDLSGKDVIRKLVILSREAGYKMEQEEVTANLFIPSKCFEGSIDDFWKELHELDTEFEIRRKQLATESKKLRFVAKMEAGVAEVGLQEVDPSHPFFELEGSNNIILITTERYKEYPMMIKGYGAGADVTAAGVFSDIISIANIR